MCPKPTRLSSNRRGRRIKNARTRFDVIVFPTERTERYRRFTANNGFRLVK